jgi:hypothetical protein
MDVMGIALSGIVSICMRNGEALQRHVTSKRAHHLLEIVENLAGQCGLSEGLSMKEAATMLSFSSKTLMLYFLAPGDGVGDRSLEERDEEAKNALSLCFGILHKHSKKIDEKIIQWISLCSIGLVLSIWRMPHSVWSEEWKEPLATIIRTMHVVGEKLSNPIREVTPADIHLPPTIMMDLWKESLEGMHFKTQFIHHSSSICSIFYPFIPISLSPYLPISLSPYLPISLSYNTCMPILPCVSPHLAAIFDLWSCTESFQGIDIPMFRSILEKIEEIQESLEAEMLEFE